MRKSQKRISGALVLAMTGVLMTTGLAASGQTTYDRAGIMMFGESKVGVGETITAPNGQQIPGVITYIDAAGGTTNYLPVRMVAELFDAPVAWDSATSSVVLGSTGRKPAISVSAGSSASSSGEIPTTPEIGAVAGPFTEISPADADTTGAATIWLNHAVIQSDTGIKQRFTCAPGGVMEIIVTNNGSADQTINVYRPITVSNGGMETFRSVRIPAGKTLTRTFQVSADATVLTRVLEMTVDSGSAPGMSDLEITAKEYLPKQ